MLRIERTFLINELPADYKNARTSKIRQCYLINSADACRIREKDGEWTIARKLFTRPGDLGYREFEEFAIAKEEFEIIWEKAANSRLEKNRYYYSSTVGFQLRIDEFLSQLSGLYLAEMIFANEASQGGIEQLGWLGKEITGETWAYNQFLSTKTYSEVQELIGPFGGNIH